MNFEQYSGLAIRTANLDADSLVNAALGISGEAGEIADHIKKHRFQGHDLNTAELVKEAGDVLWYLNLLACALGMPLEEIAAQNISKLRQRYSDGKFSVERSVNRNV